MLVREKDARQRAVKDLAETRARLDKMSEGIVDEMAHEAAAIQLAEVRTLNAALMGRTLLRFHAEQTVLAYLVGQLLPSFLLDNYFPLESLPFGPLEYNTH